MKFNNLKVAHKLWLSVIGLMAVIVLVAGALQMRVLNTIDAAERLVDASEQQITAATQWRGLVVTALTLDMAGLVTTDEALSKDFSERRLAISAEITPIQEAIAASAVTLEGKAALGQIAVERANLRSQAETVKQLRATGDTAARQAFSDTFYKPSAKVYLDAIDKYLAVQARVRDATRAAAVEVRYQTMLVAALVAAVVFGFGMLLSAMLVRSINRPLAQAMVVAEAIAAGDLTQEVQESRGDEFGHLLRSLSGMSVKLRNLVAEVRTGTESVSTASNEIANGNQDLSNRTEQTAANLQQTASSMEELTSTVTQSADTARQASQLASTAAQAATRGGEVVGQVEVSMQNISNASRKIADIIGTIDGIAFQTNILALNAAVEAARAGEQGRGFAVVAAEVRSLAKRSADAAKEIKMLITASEQTVQSGTQQVTQAGVAMAEIVSSVRRVSDLIGEISAASNEQRDGISHVNSAVANLDQMTQQNAALVEESAAAATGLRDQAQYLAQVVSVFNVGASLGTVLVGGRGSNAGGRSPVSRPTALSSPALRASITRGTAPKALAASRPGVKLLVPPQLAGSVAKPVVAKPVAEKLAKPAAVPPLLTKSVAVSPSLSPALTAKSNDSDWESF